MRFITRNGTRNADHPPQSISAHRADPTPQPPPPKQTAASGTRQSSSDGGTRPRTCSSSCSPCWCAALSPALCLDETLTRAVPLQVPRPLSPDPNSEFVRMQMSLDMHGLDLSRDPDPAYENLSVDSVSLLSRFFSLSSSSRPRTSTSPRCRVCANTNDFEHTRAHAPGDRRGEQGAATNERRARCRRPLPEPRRSPLAPCRSQALELNHAIASSPSGYARSMHVPAPRQTTRLG